MTLLFKRRRRYAAPVSTTTYAADFEKGNSEYLSIAHGDQTGLDFGDTDWTIAGWFNLESRGFGQTIFSKWSQAKVDGYFLNVDGSNHFYFILADGGTVCNPLGTHGALSIGTWYFFAASHDATANIGSISLNAGTPDTDAESAPPADSATAFEVSNKTLNPQLFDGKQAYLAAWAAVLSGATLTALYNSGPTLRYAGVTAAQKTNLISWWDFEEKSGTRSDSHGSNDLTDNNTVGRALVVYP